MGVPTDQPTEHRHLEHDGSLGARLNWLRAGVLGANDGIVSVAGIVVGVAGATSNRGTILTAGVAGLVAGALSMAAGEYVSVSTQRDTEKALLAKEARELVEMPEEELKELVQIYRDKGLSERLAHEVAVELTERDASPADALSRPVTTSARTTATNVTGTRQESPGSTTASSGSSAPRVKATAEARAACQGFVRSSGSRPSSAST